MPSLDLPVFLNKGANRKTVNLKGGCSEYIPPPLVSPCVAARGHPSHDHGIVDVQRILMYVKVFPMYSQRIFVNFMNLKVLEPKWLRTLTMSI